MKSAPLANLDVGKAVVWQISQRLQQLRVFPDRELLLLQKVNWRVHMSESNNSQQGREKIEREIKKCLEGRLGGSAG